MFLNVYSLLTNRVISAALRPPRVTINVCGAPVSLGAEDRGRKVPSWVVKWLKKLGRLLNDRSIDQSIVL